MREIKFRAWNEELKRMAYSDDEHFKTFGWWGVIILNREPKTETGEIAMQYTGLKDKNGKEIYEGDIIKYPDGNNRIDFIDGSFVRFFVGGQAYTPINQKDMTEVEIIGNIYSNPELLT